MIIQMGKFIFMKTLRPGWLSAPAWGGDIYMYMTIIFKHRLCNRMADQSQTSWKGNESLY